tara:strand:- start:129 stop:875 length:747 start_codon:yes stop_codon:yes gene_type:complete
MKVSIITVCYNRINSIEKAILSVLNQDYQNIEYIIIDGDSNDGTKKLLEKYKNQLSKFVSESDNGMYDAINKGLGLATGDIVGLMHSDDEFYNSNVISQIVKEFKKVTNIEAVYGDGVYVTNDEKEKLVRNRIGGEFSLKRVKNGWLPLHPTVYIKRATLNKYGFYNLDFKIASDTEFLLRYLYKHKIKTAYLNKYILKMKMGGFSTSKSRVLQVLKEDYQIYKFHKLFALKSVVLKKMRAFTQYIIK